MKLSTPKRSEVDMRVAQEIKNHVDYMQELNQKQENLYFSFKSIHDKFNKHQAEVSSRQKDFEITLENFMHAVDEKIYRYENRISDFEKENIDLLELMKKHLSMLTQEIAKIEGIDKDISNIYTLCQALEHTTDRLSESGKQSLRLISGRIDCELDSLRNQMHKDSCKDDPTERILEEKLAPMKVDHAGLMKEISFLKKSNEYNVKKFEHVFTQLDRLKAGRA